MYAEETANLPCPYCWQINLFTVELVSDGEHEFVQDCEVCCHPILIHVSIRNNTVLNIEALREND